VGFGVGRALSFALLVAALAWAAPAARAQDGDVFLIVSLEAEFDTSVEFDDEDFGSPTIVVRIGSLTSGVQDPRQTHFLPEEEPPTVPLGDIDLSELDGNESTIFGSFTTEEFDSTEPHMVTPAAGAIDPEIQAAVFAASPFLAAAADETPFMTTGEVAEIVYDAANELAGEGGTDLTLSEIAEALFGASTPLGVTEEPDETFSCEAEGELFPHQPKEEPVFAFEFAFDEDGTFSSLDVCFLVEAEVKENSVNLGKNGSVSIAIYSSDTFDSDDIDETTVEIDGVFADEVHFAANKATAQFSVQDLVDAGVLASDTTEVTIQALLSDGSCIDATIPIKVK
jgi:hypothetical protein